MHDGACQLSAQLLKAFGTIDLTKTTESWPADALAHRQTSTGSIESISTSSTQCCLCSDIINNMACTLATSHSEVCNLDTLQVLQARPGVWTGALANQHSCSRLGLGNLCTHRATGGPGSSVIDKLICLKPISKPFRISKLPFHIGHSSWEKPDEVW